MKILPGVNFAHVGCVTCGAIFIAPLKPEEDPPWCNHGGLNYTWSNPHHMTQKGKNPWARMVRVSVWVENEPVTVPDPPELETADA